MRLSAVVAAMLVAASPVGAVKFVDGSETGVAVAASPRGAAAFAAGNDIPGAEARGQTRKSDSKAADYVPVSLIPEPAIWGLLIAGFSLVGISARRRALRRAHPA